MKEQREKAILDTLVRLARPEILREFRLDSCIASTAIGIAVLQRFGFTARALAVDLKVFNQPFVEHLRRAGALPQTPEEALRWRGEGCYSVQVDLNADQPGRWAGHLVAIAENRWLVDLSID